MSLTEFHKEIEEILKKISSLENKIDTIEWKVDPRSDPSFWKEPNDDQQETENEPIKTKPMQERKGVKVYTFIWALFPNEYTFH